MIQKVIFDMTILDNRITILENDNKEWKENNKISIEITNLEKRLDDLENKTKKL